MRRRYHSGLTLIESVLALAILSICIAGFTSLVLHGRELSNMARDHYTAINIAKNRIERARALDYEQVPGLSDSGLVVNENGAPSSSGNFRRTTTVSTVSTNLMQITVNVAIRNRRTLVFGSENERISTFLALYLEPGP